MSVYSVWTSLVMGAGSPNNRALAQMVEGPKDFYYKREDREILQLLTKGQQKNIQSVTLEEAGKVWADLMGKGACLTSVWDPDFPHRLKGRPDSPLVLFYKGDLSLLSQPLTVGMIGSRHCSSDGIQACKDLARGFVENGAVIVSGLAQGIDGLSHSACIERGGRTVAFVGVPIGRYYPESNRKLQEKIEREHLLVTEYRDEKWHGKSSFLLRNRLIAMASDALCVLQAGEKSGSMSTVNKALGYEKPVFAVPGSLYSEMYRGSNRLLGERKAMALTKAEDVMSYLGVKVTDTAKTKKETTLISATEDMLPLLAFIDGRMSPAAIARARGANIAFVKTALSRLELDGFVKRSPRGDYIKTN